MSDESTIGFVNEHDRQLTKVMAWLSDLGQRLEALEVLLNGSDTHPESQWDYHELRTIIDKTDLTPDMDIQALRGLDDRVKVIEDYLEQAGTSTKFHVGNTNLTVRLNDIEGKLSQIWLGPRIHSDVTDVGKSEATAIRVEGIPGAGKSLITTELAERVREIEPIEKRAVRLTVELAQVLRDLNAGEDESDCRLKEGIVEAIERAAGLEVG